VSAWNSGAPALGGPLDFLLLLFIIIIIIIKDIYIGLAQVRKGHKCAVSAEMAVWLRNCLCLYLIVKTVKQKCLQMSSESLLHDVT